jgi:RimJ/RimL family protein N-acetyltransferase
MQRVSNYTYAEDEGSIHMYEIACGNRELAKSIVKSHSDIMFAGVVAGNNAGRIWADDMEDPASALVWSDGLECFQFMGFHTNRAFVDEFRTFFDSNILSFLKERDIQYFEYAADTDEWYPVIRNVFSDYEIKENWQYVYRSDKNTLKDEELILPDSYYLHRVDQSLFASLVAGLKITNPEFLTDYINQFWGSVSNYLELGAGYAVTNEGKIVSFAISSGLYEKTVSVGVETLLEHRRKGLAAIAVKTLLKELYDMNCNVWWDCMESNIASQKTIESAGLTIDHKYKVCWFDL